MYRLKKQNSAHKASLQSNLPHLTQSVRLLFSLNLTRTAVMIAQLNVNEWGKTVFF